MRSTQRIERSHLMRDDCCASQVEVAALQAQQRRVLAWAFAINTLTFVMMVTGSVMSGSSSLLSSALDNLGDAVTYAVSLAVLGASPVTKARVALLKSALIFGAALAVGAQIAWRFANLDAPIFETMGIVALLNLAANGFCLWLLTPYRHNDVNMASVWECSRNDVFEGFAVVAAAIAVWVFDSGWPDVLIATALLILFLRSATRILRRSWRELHPAVSSG